MYEIISFSNEFGTALEPDIGDLSFFDIERDFEDLSAFSLDTHFRAFLRPF